MRDIAELTVLLRAPTEMPDGLKLARDDFREGWNRVRTYNAKGLEKKIKARRWEFIPASKCIVAAGLGESPKQAIARALDHALAQVSSHLNAIEIRNIQTTQYPWFWVVRLSVNAFRIQQSEAMPVPEGQTSFSDRLTEEQRCIRQMDMDRIPETGSPLSNQFSAASLTL